MNYTTLIRQALYHELNVEKKPGLITPTSNGCHTDMDWHTFSSSIEAIAPEFAFFLNLAQTAELPQLLEAGRPHAIAIEQKMLDATGNINTHKGAIYLFSITSMAIGHALIHRLPFSALPRLISSIAHQEMFKLTQCTHAVSYGQKIYQQYHIGGIIEEVHCGIPHVFQGSLPFYHACTSTQKDLATLLYLMSYVQDSTVLHHNSIEVLEEMHDQARSLLQSCLQEEECFEAQLDALGHHFKIHRISPGGCADLLALTFFLDAIEKHWTSLTPSL